MCPQNRRSPDQGVASPQIVVKCLFAQPRHATISCSVFRNEQLIRGSRGDRAGPTSRRQEPNHEWTLFQTFRKCDSLCRCGCHSRNCPVGIPPRLCGRSGRSLMLIRRVRRFQQYRVSTWFNLVKLRCSMTSSISPRKFASAWSCIRRTT